MAPFGPSFFNLQLSERHREAYASNPHPSRVIGHGDIGRCSAGGGGGGTRAVTTVDPAGAPLDDTGISRARIFGRRSPVLLQTDAPLFLSLRSSLLCFSFAVYGKANFQQDCYYKAAGGRARSRRGRPFAASIRKPSPHPLGRGARVFATSLPSLPNPQHPCLLVDYINVRRGLLTGIVGSEIPKGPNSREAARPPPTAASDAVWPRHRGPPATPLPPPLPPPQRPSSPHGPLHPHLPVAPGRPRRRVRPPRLPRWGRTRGAACQGVRGALFFLSDWSWHVRFGCFLP